MRKAVAKLLQSSEQYKNYNTNEPKAKNFAASPILKLRKAPTKDRDVRYDGRWLF